LSQPGHKGKPNGVPHDERRNEVQSRQYETKLNHGEHDLHGKFEQQQISYEDFEPRCETESDSELADHRARVNDLLLPQTPTKKQQKHLASLHAAQISTHGAPTLMHTLRNGKQLVSTKADSTSTTSNGKTKKKRKKSSGPAIPPTG
jgi:hypothetical protein